MENWLRQTFQDAPTDGPATKKIKFSDIHQGLSQQFPSDNISAQCCSKIVDNVFPESKRVRVGKQRVCYVVGLQSFVSPEHVQAENIQLKATVQQLQERIRELEGGTSPSMLPKCDCTPLLLRQMDSLLQHGDHIIHGPSTPARFPYKHSLMRFALQHQMFIAYFSALETQRGTKWTKELEKSDYVSMHGVKRTSKTSKWSSTTH